MPQQALSHHFCALAEESGKPALVMDLKYKIRQRFSLPDLIKANHHITDDRATIVGAFYNADKGARATLRYVAGNNINFFIEVCL